MFFVREYQFVTLEIAFVDMRGVFWIDVVIGPSLCMKFLKLVLNHQ